MLQQPGFGLVVFQNVGNPAAGEAVAVGIGSVAHGFIGSGVGEQAGHFLIDGFFIRAHQLQGTGGDAYKKGVELTMNELLKIFTGLGVEVFGNVGDEFDPNLHNAVMHIDSDELDENTIAQVFQKGFKIGEKVVRFAMVQVAN